MTNFVIDIVTIFLRCRAVGAGPLFSKVNFTRVLIQRRMNHICMQSGQSNFAGYL